MISSQLLLIQKPEQLETVAHMPEMTPARPVRHRRYLLKVGEESELPRMI
jgi:hypothetical protein